MALLSPPAVPEMLQIPRVVVTLVKGVTRRTIDTSNSAVLLHALTRSALERFRVGVMTEEGRILDTDSLLALNAYFRTARNPRGAVFPFRRLDSTPIANTRSKWRMFKAYLGLTFL